jgi:glycosyltransferase involved in cell wall biosynthesis
LEKNQLVDNVNLLGCIPNKFLPAFYRKADVYVLPARFEPFGMAALEAMACQVPAVISQYASIIENLTDGEEFFKVDPYDSQQLADIILKLLNDEELAKKIAKKGRETVVENFSWDAIALMFIKFYDQDSENLDKLDTSTNVEL